MISEQQRFFVSALDPIPVPDGFHIVVLTDVPCHLFCRMTHIKPEEHLVSRILRGTRVWDNKRFCFVVYEDNEQIEEGDTLVHTFVKLNWPVCQTRWFYFYATIDGVISPSTTAILKLHRAAAEWERLIFEPWTWTAPPPPDMAQIWFDKWIW